MNATQQLCDVCAERGLDAISASLDACEDLDALAKAFTAAAERERDPARAERLRGAAQYVSYLALPYDYS